MDMISWPAAQHNNRIYFYLEYSVSYHAIHKAAQRRSSLLSNQTCQQQDSISIASYTLCPPFVPCIKSRHPMSLSKQNEGRERCVCSVSHLSHSNKHTSFVKRIYSITVWPNVSIFSLFNVTIVLCLPLLLSFCSWWNTDLLSRSLAALVVGLPSLWD